MIKKTFLILALLMISTMLVSGCSGSKNQAFGLAPMDDMPHEVQTSPKVVHEAYRFAVANPDVLTELPCYCGCGGMGHTSNYSCYVANENSDGSLNFDNHALGCSICVDITQDAMRMLDEGKLMTEIRSYVDQTYSAFGPSNMP
ncbi:MAG: hypothetical protein ISR58_04060 [Anaerolineales bacterium]|nr:hypothetical protein [Chloroflexota bacterium]MBL6980347.1 hypothetical protein [Anaerolineales bacterium]